MDYTCGLLGLLLLVTAMLKIGEAVQCYVCSDCKEYAYPDSDIQSGCSHCKTIADPTTDEVSRSCESSYSSPGCRDKVVSSEKTTECICNTDKCNGEGSFPSTQCYVCTALEGCGDTYTGKTSHIRNHCEYCEKAKGEFAGIKGVERKCKLDEKPSEFECTKLNFLGIKSTDCKCEGNLCNTAVSLQGVYHLVMLIPFVRLLNLF